MHIFTRAEIAKGAAERWKEGYYRGGKWRTTDFGSTKKVYDQLIAAGESITPEQVSTITGVESWTRNRCIECGRDVEVTVRFVMEPGWEWADICPNCLREALTLLEKENDHG